jgi:GT2 family glycosyltransferase
MCDDVIHDSTLIDQSIRIQHQHELIMQVPAVCFNPMEAVHASLTDSVSSVIIFGYSEFSWSEELKT